MGRVLATPDQSNGTLMVRSPDRGVPPAECRGLLPGVPRPVFANRREEGVRHNLVHSRAGSPSREHRRGRASFDTMTSLASRTIDALRHEHDVLSDFVASLTPEQLEGPSGA